MADGYTVVSQAETVGKLPDDSYGQVVRVTFRTSSGTVAKVDVPSHGYNADTVRAAIEAKKAELDAVEAL